MKALGLVLAASFLNASLAFAATAVNDEMATAIAHSDFAKVKVLKNKGQSLDAVASDGTTGLMRLAGEGDTASVREALKLGATPEVKSAKGETALWYAVYGGHEELALEMISKGAKADGVLEASKECLLHYAAKAQLSKLAA